MVINAEHVLFGGGFIIATFGKAKKICEAGSLCFGLFLYYYSYHGGMVYMQYRFTGSCGRAKLAIDWSVCPTTRIAVFFALSQTKSHASTGIQCGALPSHLILQPIGFVIGTLTDLPAKCSVNALSRSLTLILLVSRGLSTPRPVYMSLRSLSKTKK